MLFLHCGAETAESCGIVAMRHLGLTHEADYGSRTDTGTPRVPSRTCKNEYEYYRTVPDLTTAAGRLRLVLLECLYPRPDCTSTGRREVPAGGRYSYDCTGIDAYCTERTIYRCLQATAHEYCHVYCLYDA